MNGLLLGSSISDHIVSNCDISRSGLRLHFNVFLKYNIIPPPLLSCVSSLSLRIKSNPVIATWLPKVVLFKNASQRPKRQDNYHLP